MDWEWWYFVLGIIAWPFIRLLAHTINQAVIEYRQKRILKLVNIEFPDQSKVTFITIDTSDRRAMRKLERELREQYDVPDKNRSGDSGFDGVLRRTPSRPSEDPPR